MKKSLSIVLASMLILTALPANAHSTEKYNNGDVNRDKVVSIKDVTEIQRSIANNSILYDDQKKLADFNLDGKVNIMDSTKMQKVLAGMEEIPVDPADPTPATEDEANSNVNIYFTNNRKMSDVYFYLYNSTTGEEKSAYPGDKITSNVLDDKGYEVFCSTIDTSKWDRIIFNDGTTTEDTDKWDKIGNNTWNRNIPSDSDISKKTIPTPVSKASSGFSINRGSSSAMIPNVYAYTGANTGTLNKTTLEYSEGYEKKIWVWTPKDYSADKGKKYKTIYLTDGQNLFSDHTDGYGGWQIANTVEALMANGNEGYILVGIDNGNDKRDSELTPDIGEIVAPYQKEFASRTGEAFSKFVTDKVMPYVQANYNSSTKASDNSIMGSSSGGLEAFYIGMENMEKFGSIGALSPAFALFDTSVWEKYLSKYDFTSVNVPKLYIYNGNNDGTEKELYQGAIQMNDYLKTLGYNENKIKLYLEEKNCHNEGYWRVVFPETLCWCFDQ